MGHRFDSGLDRAQRRLIREAIIAQLGQLIVATKPEANGQGATEDKFVVSVVPLAAPITDFQEKELGEHFLNQVVGNSPTICVALGKRTFDATSQDARQWRGLLEVHIYAVSTHARGLVERLAGDDVADADDTKDPGLETMCEHIFERLAGWPLTAARADELIAVSEDFVWTDGAFTVVELLFTTQVTTNVNPARDKAVIAEVVETTHTDVAAGDPSDVVTETELEAP